MSSRVDEDRGISYNKVMENHEDELKAWVNALLTVPEVAEEKGVSRQAVADAVRAGTLKAIREKRPRLFRREDVARWTPYGALIQRRARQRREGADAGQPRSPP